MKQAISVLSIIFILVLTTVSSGCRREVYEDYGDDKDLKVLHEKTFQISPGKSLRLEGSSGDITLTTWDKSEVYVKISGNEKAERKVEFSFDNNEDRVEVIARGENSFWNWGSGIRLNFEIKVPVNFNPKVSTSGGDIRLAGVDGNVAAKTSGGDVSVKYTKGNLNISTSGGDINLENTRGIMHASTSGGNIKGTEFEGALEVSTSGGDITLKGANTEIEASTSGGDVELRYTGENKGIELSTSGGDIDVFLPADFNASARLSSSGGDVDCDFAANNAIKISSTKFEADLNSGGKSLIAKTSGGNIRVSKR